MNATVLAGPQTLVKETFDRSRRVARWLPSSSILSVFGGQGAVSLQSFISSFAMIRSGTKSEFGLYMTVLAGVNLLSALQIALATGPLLVLVPGLPLER